MSTRLEKLRVAPAKRKRLPRLYFSLLTNRYDTSPLAVHADWAYLRDLLRTPNQREEKDGPAWNFAKFKRDGTRTDADVQGMFGFVADIDDARNLSPAEASNRLNGYTHAIHSSWSHTQNQPRFRIVLPFKQIATVEQYYAAFEHFQEIFEDVLDKSGRAPSHLYYLPAVLPERVGDFTFIEKLGEPFNPDTLDPPSALRKVRLKERAKENRDRPDVNWDDVRTLLDVIPAEIYDYWIKVGFILHDLNPDPRGEGRALWDEWSARSSKYDPKRNEYEWRRMKEGGGLTIGTLRFWAKKFAGDITWQAEYSDVANAENFVRRYGDDMRYCAPLRSWYLWTGTRWAQDDKNLVRYWAVETVKAMYAEASKVQDDNRRRQLVEYALKAENATRINALISLAAAMPGVPVTPDKFDADPWLLNVENGTVNLKTGELRPHSRDDLITKICPVAYDPEAESAVWDKVLRDATNNDEELEHYIQRAFGMSASGEVREEVLFFIYGPGASAKSTVMEGVTAALGDYATRADFESFMAKGPASGAREDIARLAGARLVSSVETENGRKLAVGLVKLLTGGDKVAARFLYRGTFEFLPQFTLWLVANHSPRVDSKDGAFWRRIKRIPFEHVIPFEQRDPNVKLMVRSDEGTRKAVLAWIVKGCLDYQKHGLKEPKSVHASTMKYKDEMDTVAEFLKDTCRQEPAASIELGKLYDTFKVWAASAGAAGMTKRAFAETLREKGFVTKPVRNTYITVLGITLIEQGAGDAGE